MRRENRFLIERAMGFVQRIFFLAVAATRNFTGAFDNTPVM
jgi:hypothetical protein